MADRGEAARIEAGVEQLGTEGYWISAGLLADDLVVGLCAEQRLREARGDLHSAGTGRSGDAQHTTGFRQAQSSWFTADSGAERDFLAFAERVRLSINRRLMLGLFDFEAQFLHYPPGGYYRRHLDALQGGRGRVVSMIAYLNADWTREDGGGLAVWAKGGAGEPATVVVPLAGTVVLMLSEEIPHEARTSRRDRRAIAGWYSINASTASRSDPAR